MIRRRWFAVALVASLGTLNSQGCSKANTVILDPAHETVEDIARIEVADPGNPLEVGSSLQLQARAFCAHGMPIEGIDFHWSTATPDRVKVSSDGLVTALRSGLAVVQVGSGRTEQDVVVRIEPFGRVIGADGGLVSYRDGRVSIRVGAGVLAEPVRLTVEEAYDVPTSGIGNSTLVPGTAYSLGPAGQQFRDPVEIRIQYDESRLGASAEEARFRIHRLHDVEGRWLPLDMSTADPAAHAVSAFTTTFSLYSVLEYRPAAQTVIITPWDDTLAVASTVQLDAAVLDADGAPVVAPDPISWTSSDPGIASVSQTGEVTGLSPGTVTIVATSSGSAGEATVAVYGRVSRVELVPPSLWITTGKAGEIEAVLYDEAGAPVKQAVVWMSTDESVATVSGTGEVLGLASGEATIVASSGEMSGEASVYVTPPPASVVISPPGGYFAVGDTISFTAQVLDGRGQVLARPVAWSASDPTALVGPGRVYSSRATTIGLVATVDDVASVAMVTFLDPEDLPGTIELDPESVSTSVGESVQVTARVADRLGTELPDAPVTWTMGNESIADVDGAGLVTGVAEGQTLLVARSGHATAVVEVLVGPRQGGEPVRVEVWPRAPELEVGGSARLAALVYDQEGIEIPGAEVVWTSANAGVAQVDATGLLTGIASGATTITAAVGPLTASVVATVVEPDAGGHDEGLGNNLSWPVVFAEGLGLSGQSVTADPGLRPRAAEGVSVTTLPFFAPANAVDYVIGGRFYLQQGANTWQAEWLDGAGEVRPAIVAWGDNLTHHTFNTHSMIRVETSLTSLSDPPLSGFNMKHLYGQGSTEMQGTDGTLGTFTPSLFTLAARLTVEKLDNATFEPVFTLFDGTVAEGLSSEGPGVFGAEVNVAGKVVYGYNLRIRDAQVPTNVEKYGWWRLTFSLDDDVEGPGPALPRGVRLEQCGNAPAPGDEPLVYSPVLDAAAQRTVLDIWIASASGGGGGGGGHGGGGGCGGH